MSKCLSITCPDDTLDYTADLPDVQQFIGLGYGPIFDPPLNSKWTNLGSFNVSYSANSALESALAALAQSIQETVAGWETQTDQPIPTYGNAPTSATGFCPDGSMFTYGVVGGLFVALTQAQADAAAQSYVSSQLLPLHIVCLSDLPPSIFASVNVTEIITASGGAVGTTVGSNQWNVIGSLPPGLTLTGDSPVAGQATLAGECQVAGTYNFSIQIITPAGDYMQKAYTMVVEGVLTNSPASSQFAFVPYNFQFSVQSGFTPATFAITGGALPPGMAMTTGGFITGTPEALGSYTFTVTVSMATNEVSQNFTMNVASPFTNSPPATANQGIAVNFQFQTQPGTNSLTYSLANGTLPQGLSFNSSGLLSGTPAVAQSFASIFTVNATDGVGTISEQFSLVIGNAEQVTPPVNNAIETDFNSSNPLNPGTYQVNYVTGALQYGDQSGKWGVGNDHGTSNAGAYGVFPEGIGIPCSPSQFSTPSQASAASQGVSVTFTLNSPNVIGVALLSIGYAGNAAGSPSPTFSLIRTG